MRRNFKIILDCDDVLYQCNLVGIKNINERYGMNFSMSDIDKWGLLNNTLDRRLELFANPDFVARQPLYPNAKEFVSELSKRAEIFIATNVPAQCAGARINAIVRDFPEIPVSNILIGGRKDILRADMMLDDAPQNMEGANVRYPVLYRQPWNYGKTGMLSVSTLQEFITLADMIRENESGAKTYPKAIVLVGPSGSGKKKLAEKLCSLSRLPITRVFSYSTNNAPDYNHISKSDFEAMRTIFFETSSYMGPKSMM